MVDVLMLASLGATNLSDLLILSQEYDVVKKERTQSFFSNRSIYDATAFTQTNGSGDETAYLGHVTIAPNGRLGFDPSVVLSGDVAGGSIHDFLANEIAGHHDASTIVANLFGGNDVVIGNGRGYSYISGYDGDDVLLNASAGADPESFKSISGGDGNDLIFMAAAYASGGAGADTFVVDTRGDFTWQVYDFERGIDKILLDRTLFPELGSRITKANFHLGPSAADADDRIIVSTPEPGQSYREVYIDPDGVGGVAQTFIGSLYSEHDLKARDFGMVDAAKLMPDISKLFDMGAQPIAGPRLGHAFSGDHAGLAHSDPSSLLHHGLIQLV